MNTEQARYNMIEQQIRTWNVLNPEVLDLLKVVKREAFVPAAYKSLAFMDTEIPLPCDANMLAPKVEARILQEAEIKPTDNVLEIGAGTGYMAALLAHQAKHVTTVEIEPALVAMAEKNLASYGLKNVDVVLGNGARGWEGTGAQAAPYDVIVISGALPVLPDAFLKQLKVGGRLLAIVGTAPVMVAQKITRLSDVSYETVALFDTYTTPLREAEAPEPFKF